MNQAQLINELKQWLSSEEAKKFDLRLFEDDVQQEGGWWYVPVASGVANVNAFQYSPLLNRIEEEFEAQGTKVLLIPAMTD